MSNGGPAFPLQSIGPDFAPGHSGMTLRDYFAAKAMHAALTGAALPGLVERDPEILALVTKMAEGVYIIADAMLKERAK